MENEGMNNEGMNVKLKHFVSLTKGRNPMAFLDSGIYPYLTMDYLRGRDKDVKYVDFDEKLVPVKENEILILWDGANAGEIMQSKVGFLSSTMAKISAKNEKLANHYLFYLLKNFEKVLKDFAGGTTIPHLDPQVLLHSSFFIPSLKKQTAIAAFLDDKTAKIDRAIAQKEKMIALLKERKQIIIQNAVTKGLNYDLCDENDSPDAQGKNQSPSHNHKKSQFRRMKHSGVEWIGEIPEGWEVPKMKHLCHFILDGTHGSFPRVENGYRLLSVRNIIDGKFVFRDDDSMVSTRHFKEISSKFEIQEGDIQLAIVGATMGKVAIVENLSERIVTQRSLSTIRINQSKCMIKYVTYFIQSELFQSFLWNNTGFSAQPGIYLGTIQNAHLPMPRIEEQEKIVTHIETQSTKIDKAIKLQEQQIEKLKELKSTLIDSAVTGKIKVN